MKRLRTSDERCSSCGDPLHESEARKGKLCNVCIKWRQKHWHKRHKHPRRKGS